MEFVHKSVLLDETIEGLAIKPDGILSGRDAGRRYSRKFAGGLS